jgi:transposase
VTLFQLRAVEVFRMLRCEAGMSDEHELRQMKERRVEGARLLQSGVHAAEVARRTGVSRQSVMRWERRLKAGGMKDISRVGKRGRPRQLTEAQLGELAQLLKAGSIAAGYANEMWTLPRIGALIQARFNVTLTNTSVWRTLGHMGWSVQRPAKQARQRDESAITTWKRKRWPALKK